MAAPERRDSFIIRSEFYSWVLLVAGIFLAVASLLLGTLNHELDFGRVVITVLLAGVAVYGGACVVWHRRRSGNG